MVFVGGEAGAGKTALLRAFCDGRRDRRASSGAPATPCSPRARSDRSSTSPRLTGGELEELVSREAPAARGHRRARPRAGRRAPDRARARGPPLGRRGDARRAAPAGPQGRGRARRSSSPATATTSSTAPTRSRSCSASWPRRARSRGSRSRRSPRQAVGELAAPHGVDAAELHRQTTGNPFFVTEVLAAGTGEIPHTVRDAVLARVARLSARRAPRCSRRSRSSRRRPRSGCSRRSPATTLDRLEECLASGMLAARSRRRRLPARARPPRRRGGARAAPAGRAAPRGARRARRAAGRRRDPARLAHHAEAAGDADAVLRFAPAAAARAASLGAHREAAAQYARALRFADALPRGGARRRCSSAAPTSAT